MGQPVSQLVLIGASELPKPEHIPDLGAVIFDRPAAEAIRRQLTRVHLDLLGYVCHCSSGKFGSIPREPGFDLEKLQDQTETQSRRSGLVADQIPVLTDQRP